MTIEIIRNQAELDRSRDKWNAAAGDRVFQSWEWCRNWMKHLGFGQPWVAYELDTQGQWQGFAPMAMCRTKLNANKLCVMGSGTCCTDYVGLVSSQPSLLFASKFAAMLESINRRSSPDEQVEVVEFEGCELDAPQTRHLTDALERIGYQAHPYVLGNCWRLELPSSWEELNSRFSKKHRRKTKKAVQRLQADGTRIDHASAGNFDGIWSNFVRLHQLRRESTGLDGCFGRRGFEPFLRSATADLIQRDLAELVQVSVDGRAIAAALLFRDGQTAYMYQTGFDPLSSQLEPGYLLIVKSLQWAIEQGLSQFDFMRGDEPYKARWNTEAIPMGTLRFVNTSQMAARIRHQLWQGQRQLRSQAKWFKTQLSTWVGGTPPAASL